MRAWLAIGLGALIAGCTPPPPDKPQAQTPPPPEVSVQEQSPLYAQLHSALFQADAAVNDLGKSIDAARTVRDKIGTDDAAGAMDDMIATLEDAKSQLGEMVSGQPPTEKQVLEDEAGAKRKRADLVNAVSDVVKDMREQEGVAASLAEDGPQPARKPCARLDELLNRLIDDLLGTLKALDAAESAD